MSAFLRGYKLERLWCEENNVTPRTSYRYRNEPDGLPFVIFGGRVYIDEDGGREWLKRRTQQRNPVRRAA